MLLKILGLTNNITFAFKILKNNLLSIVFDSTDKLNLFLNFYNQF